MKINKTDQIMVLQEKLNKEGIDITFSDTGLLVEQGPNYVGLTQELIDALWSIAGVSPEDGNFIMDLNPELYDHIMINHTKNDYNIDLSDPRYHDVNIIMELIDQEILTRRKNKNQDKNGMIEERLIKLSIIRELIISLVHQEEDGVYLYREENIEQFMRQLTKEILIFLSHNNEMIEEKAALERLTKF